MRFACMQASASTGCVHWQDAQKHFTVSSVHNLSRGPWYVQTQSRTSCFKHFSYSLCSWLTLNLCRMVWALPWGPLECDINQPCLKIKPPYGWSRYGSFRCFVPSLDLHTSRLCTCACYARETGIACWGNSRPFPI
ncbi:hypothetical protein BDW02DRAFT_362632 [Decorospora gaudefroyi]|uniref:Uncharacterized protein n=1 Tax=Decorospora gaudefroyi TaxID=184978 RepID=A0A6A5KT68_9PLEO|nr:hypothetical protein BDW02DRAFT_362632 [Decorospora gaudefroyi]